MSRPKSTQELLPSERAFLQVMQNVAYGRAEFLRIEKGELVLDPWPMVVRHVKFGVVEGSARSEHPSEFNLKEQVSELFEYVRALQTGEIRTLEVRNGLPFSMEIELPSKDRRYTS